MNQEHETAIEKILKGLFQGEFSTQELSEKLNLPMGTVRATLSQLRHMGLVDRIPQEKNKKTGHKLHSTTFTLTQEGRDYVKKKMETPKE